MSVSVRGSTSPRGLPTDRIRIARSFNSLSIFATSPLKDCPVTMSTSRFNARVLAFILAGALASACGGTSGTDSSGGQPQQSPVATVTVLLVASSLTVGQTTSGSAVVKDAAGTTLTGRALTWSSSNTSVATVDSGGTVTGVGRVARRSRPPAKARQDLLPSQSSRPWRRFRWRLARPTSLSARVQWPRPPSSTQGAMS